MGLTFVSNMHEKMRTQYYDTEGANNNKIKCKSMKRTWKHVINLSANARDF